MTNKPDKMKVVAEVLAGVLSKTGSIVAVTHGVDPLSVGICEETMRGIFNYLITTVSEAEDTKQILDRIRDERTAHTVDTIRDALIEAMGLKPEFGEPIDELADAVLARENGLDEERFRNALIKLLGTVTQTTAQLESIKVDTAVTRECTASLVNDMQDVKAAVGIGRETHVDSQAGQAVLQNMVESLSRQLRNYLDVEGQQKWGKINTAITERSWQKTFDLSGEMEEWLDDQGDKISAEVKARALLTLANVAVIRDSGVPFENKNDTTEAWRLLCKAEAAVGSTPSDDSAQRMLRIRAKLTYIDGDHKKAAELLEQTSGPSTLSLKMAFLEDAGKWSNVSDLAAAQEEPDKKWADDAIVAHLKAGHIDRAKAVLAWSEEQGVTVRQACVLVFVRHSYSRIIGEGRPSVLALLSQDDRQQLKELRGLITDAFAATLRDKPSSGIEAESLEIAIMLGHVLYDKQLCQNAANSLTQWKPVMLELGRGVLRGDIDPIDGLADRFIDEHDNVFPAQMMAAVLLTDVEKSPDRALKILQPLLDEGDLGHKEEVATLILIAAQYCDQAKIEDVCQRVSHALGDTHRLAGMLRAVLLAKQDDLPGARDELDKVADEQDYIWLQMSASIASQDKQWSEVAEISQQLAALTGHVEAFRNEAQAWRRAGEISKSIEPLEKIYKLTPDDLPTIQNLAMAYHLVGRYKAAAEKNEILWQTEKHTTHLARDYASCLALDGKVPEAIDLLADYIKGTGDEIEIEPLLMYAHLLHSQNRAGEALDAFLPRWDKFSDNHQYLMTMMELGYASNREDDASKALGKLDSMFKKGAIPDGVMKPCTLDNLVKMGQGHQTQRKDIDEQYLPGRLPWLIASYWIQPSNHCYLSWLMRTQPLIPQDHPETIAEHSIYSTNGFTAAEQNGQRQLVQIVAPSTDSEVVADISALITLHRLGLLQNIGNYFSKIFLPQSYRAIWIEEQIRIPHHQPRQIESRRAILKAVRDGKITVESKTSDGKFPVFDEFEKNASDNPILVRILQVAKWLTRAGKMPGSKLRIVESNQNQPAIISDGQANDALDGGEIIAKPFTLQIVYDYGLFDDLCNGLRVSIEEAELQQLENELQSQEECDKAGQWHRDLVKALADISNVEFVSLANADDEPDKRETYYGIDAALLSQQLSLPLLVDDRYCQQSLLAAAKASPCAAFGTDVLLARLMNDGVITPDQHADSMLQLIRWRYKFLVPSTDILLTMASGFKEGLPGTQLREVAVYMQDCMRDFGLYGGQEPVEPPTSMAMKLFKTWIDTVAGFVVELWWDERFSEKQAARLTRWAVQYFLPAWPRNMVAPTWRRVAHLRRYAILGSILINLRQKEDIRKANRVVNRVRRSLDIKEEELASTAQSVTTTIGLELIRNEHGEEAVNFMFRRILKIVYGHRSEIHWRLLPMAERLGIVEFSKIAEDMLDEHVAVIENRNHSKRLDPKVGPFAFTLDGQHETIFFLPDAFCSPQVKLRRASLDNLLLQEHCPKTANAQAVLQREADNIRAESTTIWVPAISHVWKQLKEDFILNMAGFSQAQQLKCDDGCLLCWSHLIRPTAESLLAIDSDGWQLLPHGDEYEDTLSSTLQDAVTFQDMLLRYDQQVGHLTLAPPRDLGSQVCNYVEANGHREDVWLYLEEWIRDKSRPCRRYHACQALLSNIEYIPSDQLYIFWQAVAEIAELLRAETFDSDDAQIWRLEAELAAHYLRAVDMGGYELEANRPLAVSWWAARKITELLTQSLSSEDVADKVRQWRAGVVLPNVLPTRNAWAWLVPNMYSPCRFATLSGIFPRSVAILIALGNFAKKNGLDSVPSDARTRLRECFCVALLTKDTTSTPKDTRVWMWDHSLLEAAKAFMSSLPTEEQTDIAAKTYTAVERLSKTEPLMEAMKQLATMNETDAVFICKCVQIHCYGHTDAADMLLKLFRDSKWRDACALKVPVLGWELLLQGMLFLQSKQGIDWAVELPYIFLRLAEKSSSDEERVKVFLTYLIRSSLVGNTAGAVKSLGSSKVFPVLQPMIATVREAIECTQTVSSPEVAIRLQGLTTILETF